MEKQRAANRTRKLRRARAAQKLCPPGWDWKKFVVSKTGLSQNFLTYAVKSGDLKDSLSEERMTKRRTIVRHSEYDKKVLDTIPRAE
jgi:hypothetical protein